MAIYKRGNVYWYHFSINGGHIQESSGKRNPNEARVVVQFDVEAAFRPCCSAGVLTSVLTLF